MNAIDFAALEENYRDIYGKKGKRPCSSHRESRIVGNVHKSNLISVRKDRNKILVELTIQAFPLHARFQYLHARLRASRRGASCRLPSRSQHANADCLQAVCSFGKHDFGLEML